MLQMGARTTILGSPLSNHEACSKILFDPKDEGFYCAGVTNGNLAAINPDTSGFFGDAFIIKFNRKQEIIWSYQLNKLGTQHFSDLLFDHDGNLVAAGDDSGYPLLVRMGRDGRVLKEITYTAPSTPCDHLQIWNQRYFCMGLRGGIEMIRLFELSLDGSSRVIREFPESGTYVNDFKMDPEGNFYSVGSTELALESGFSYTSPADSYFRKLDQNGNVQILKQFSDSLSSSGEGIALAPNGDLIFIGRAGPSSFVTRYSQNANIISVIWSRYLPSDGILEILPHDILISKNGDVYVGGEVEFDLFEENADTNFDAFILRLNFHTGAIVNARQFGKFSTGPGDNLNSQSCYSLTDDNLGNILCGGTTEGSTAEPRGGSGTDRDIMIWRVGPNLEF